MRGAWDAWCYYTEENLLRLSVERLRLLSEAAIAVEPEIAQPLLRVSTADGRSQGGSVVDGSVSVDQLLLSRSAKQSHAA